MTRRCPGRPRGGPAMTRRRIKKTLGKKTLGKRTKA
jgi:hypothetical protein